MSRDYRLFMSGAIVALIGRAALGQWDAPWWIEWSTAILGVWVVFDVAIGWARERKERSHDRKESVL